MDLKHEVSVPPEDNSDLIHAALRLAAEAHGAYEAVELGGAYDAEWAGWYADHMANSLSAVGYRLVEVSA